ncbi:uncharacterized protein LOC131936221 [Physella acuta]|uniref:uncharacterized protein LOC131936221 n=1 Tax=Physella acuta TaxID=109671 RepID=UPI0027DE580B|nr:uncharacterized protein LOC131936221 [Physella acuta]
MELMEAIGESIKAALSLTHEDTLTKIKDLLTQIGVTCLADLILVKEGDLTPVLKIIQARKLISFWQTTEAPVPFAAIQSAVPHAVHPTTPPASTSSDRQPREVVTHFREWDYVFEMPSGDKGKEKAISTTAARIR